MFYKKVEESSNYIKNKITNNPTIGIILGSGLDSFVNKIEDKVIINYKDIPHFPTSSVKGHAGNLIIGQLNNQTIIAMQGRFHFYEGYDMKTITYPMYVMKLLGVKNLVVTNACGAVNEELEPGDLMVISDYVNLVGINPLIGENDERFGVRFPDMSDAFSLTKRKQVKTIMEKINLPYKEGVYGYFSGPCFESAAEIRAFKVMGVDVVGMSTVPETIVGHYLGMEVIGISCITNMATGIAKVKHTHEKVIEVANKASNNLCLVLDEIVKMI